MNYAPTHREFEPPAELQDVIQCFWYDSKEFGEQETNFEVVPDGYAEIIFYFGSVCSMAHPENLQPLPSPFLIGLLDQPAVFSTKNRLEIIGIRCFPWAIFDLLGLPAEKGGVQAFEHPVARLQSSLEKCIEAGRIEDAIAGVKQYFLNERSLTSDDRTLSKAGVAMLEASGTIPVSQVAAAAHTTVRTLERKFRQSSGHTVKDVSALMRFEQVRNHLLLYPDASIAGLAGDLGYADQSHLTKEFKRFSGTTPAAFVRKQGNKRL